MKYLQTLAVSALFAVSGLISAHHMAPDEVSTFIEDQLITVDSPHLLTSDTDPSLLDALVFPSLADVDYVAVVYEISAMDVVTVVEDIINQLSKEQEVCDYAMLIEADDNGTYTVWVGVDYCDL